MGRTRSPAPRPSADVAADTKASVDASAADGTPAASLVVPRPPWLRRSLLASYGALAAVFLVFALVGESLRKPVPDGKFQMKDGGPLIDIEDFDPVELGPYPTCHPQFERHEVVEANGTRRCVRNADAPKGGPFPVGHPDNPDWIKKADEMTRKKNKEIRFKWEGLQPGLHLLSLATLCVIIAARHSVWLFSEPVASARQPAQMLQSKDAYMFPVTASIMLFGMFVLLKYVGADWIKTAITCLIVFACAVAFGQNVESFLALVREKASRPVLVVPVLGEELTLAELIGCVIGAAMGIGYVFTKNWLINNIFGLSFCLVGITMMTLSSFRTGVIMLVGLFVYDIFWVFGSKSVFGSNVMVSVATKLEAPIKLMFPRSLGGCGNLQSSMLGLGDIAVPGIFIAFMAKWDAVKMGEKASTSFVYLNTIVVAYVLSLVTTVAIMIVFNAAQPALLYIVPYILVAAVGVAVSRGELGELWSFTLLDEAAVGAPAAGSSAAPSEGKKDS